MLKSLDVLPNNLPIQLTTFIGREKEMEQVKQLLTTTRLLTILGAGGSGKTRLALQVAADLLEQFTDGVWFVELASLSDASLVPHALASLLGLRETADVPILRMLSDNLRTKTILLILDNCEHLIEAAARLSETLLQACPDLRILATSREALDIPGETVWRIPSLTLPDQVGSAIEKWSPEKLTEYEAIRLFVDRAVAATTTFKLTEQNAPAILQICEQLDGIPLAIELAAARVKVLSVEEIAARLNDRFRLLVGGSRTALPRQQTLRALVDWSYDLLSENEQTLLRRLSIFVGGLTLEAAEAVCSEPDGRPRTDDESHASATTPPSPVLRREDILDLLGRLVDKSLVIAETQESGQRYRLLETIRQYGLNHLVANNELDAMQRAHAEYFRKFAKRSFGELWGPKQGYWLPRLEAEHDNLRAALEWTEHAPDRAEQFLEFAGSLWRFWEIHGHIGEGRAWLERALALTDTSPDNLPAREVWHRANARRGAGNLARQQGDYARATTLHQQSLALFRSIDDKLGIGRELDVLGEIARFQGDYARAIQLHSEALAIRRELDDKEGIADSLNNLGVIAHDQSDYAKAKSLLEESLALRRELGDKLSLALSLNNLGLVAHAQCEYGRADELYQESIALYREQGDKLGISYALQNQANLAKDQGEFKRAKSLFAQSLRLKQELGDKRGVARATGGLAEVAFYQGEYGRAAELAQQSLEIFREVGVKRGQLLSTDILAFVAHYQGGYTRAAALADESLLLARELNTRRGIAYSHEIFGLVAYAQGKLDEAVSSLAQALALFREVGDTRNIAFTLVNLARTAYRQNERAAATRYLDESLKLSREVNDQWGIAFSLEICGLLERSLGNFDRARELLQESLRLSAAQENQQGRLNCIGALAGLAATIGETARGARLFAVAENIRALMGAMMGADDRAEYERYLTLMQQQVSAEIFKNAWSEGQALSVEQATEYALAETEMQEAMAPTAEEMK